MPIKTYHKEVTRTEKPTEFTPLDRNNHLVDGQTKGVICLCDWFIGDKVVNLLGQTHVDMVDTRAGFSSSTPPSKTIGSCGKQLTWDDTTDTLGMDFDEEDIKPTKGITLFLRVLLTSYNSNSQKLIQRGITNSSNASNWHIQSYSTSTSCRVQHGGTFYDVDDTTGGLSLNEWHTIVVVSIPGETLSLWIDGELKGSTATSPSDIMSTAGRHLVVGNADYDGDSVRRLIGSVEQFGVLHKGWTPAQVQSYTDNPYQILEPETVVVSYEPAPTLKHYYNERVWTGKPSEVTEINPKWLKQGMSVWVADEAGLDLVSRENNFTLGVDGAITIGPDGKQFECTSTFTDLGTISGGGSDEAYLVVVTNVVTSDRVIGDTSNGISYSGATPIIRSGSSTALTASKALVNGEAIYGHSAANDHALITAHETLLSSSTFGSWSSLTDIANQNGAAYSLIIRWVGKNKPTIEEAEQLVKNPWQIFEPEVTAISYNAVQAALSMLYSDSAITERPTEFVPLNLSHPIGQHICRGFIFNTYGNVHDLCGRESLVPTESGDTLIPIEIVGTPRSSGHTARFLEEIGNNKWYEFTDDTINPITSLRNFTVIVGISLQPGDLASMSSAGDDPRYFSKDIGVNTGDHTLMIGGTSAGYVRCRVGFGGARATSTLFAGNSAGDELLEDNSLNMAAITYDGTTLSMYLLRDGKEILKGTTGKTEDLTTNTDTSKVGRTSATPDNMLTGNLHFMHFINTCLSEEQLVGIHEDPYQFIEPEVIPSYYPENAGPTVTTSELSAGAFALSASSIGSLYHQKSEVSSGAFSLSGSAVTTLLSFVSSLTSDSFSLSGSSVDTLYDHLTGVDSGNYVLTGAQVSTLYDRISELISGSYTLTGDAVDTLVSLLSQLDSGSYAISGSSASTLHDQLIELASGSYTLSGSTLDSLVSLLSSLGSGSYSLSGSGIDSLYDRLFVASTGAFVLAGSTVTTSKLSASGINLDSGAFNLSGSSIGSLYDRLSGLSAGGYVITGSNVTTLLSLVSVVTNGNYTLTAASIGNLYNRISEVVAGSYALTGPNVSTLYDRISQISSGSYAATGNAVDTTTMMLSNLGAGSYVISGSAVDTILHLISGTDSASFTIYGANIDTTVTVLGYIAALPQDLITVTIVEHEGSASIIEYEGSASITEIH